MDKILLFVKDFELGTKISSACVDLGYSVDFSDEETDPDSFKNDILSENNKSILRKLTQTKKVRSRIIKLKQDINKPDFGRD